MDSSSSEDRTPKAGSSESAITAKLLNQVRAGDEDARDRLVARFLPLLQRWAHGRLPRRARGAMDTDDLVQVTLVRALDHVDEFRSRREGAFLAYLRRILLNAIRDEIRRTVTRAISPLPEKLPDKGRSGLDQVMDVQAMETYEAALAALPEVQQEAVILRLEFDLSYERIADAVQSPSANAARMMVSRALVRLSEALDEHR